MLPPDACFFRIPVSTSGQLPVPGITLPVPDALASSKLDLLFRVPWAGEVVTSVEEVAKSACVKDADDFCLLFDSDMTSDRGGVGGLAGEVMWLVLLEMWCGWICGGGGMGGLAGEVILGVRLLPM